MLEPTLLTGGRGRPSPPAFRFHTDDSSMEEVKEEDSKGAEHELSTSAGEGHQLVLSCAYYFTSGEGSSSGCCYLQVCMDVKERKKLQG